MTSKHTDPAHQREHGYCRTYCRACANGSPNTVQEAA